MMKDKAVMIWDGDCAFCARWIRRWQRLTGDSVVYMPYQSALEHYPQLTLEKCQRAVQLVDVDGKVYPAAAGVLRALKGARGYGWLYTFYQKSPIFAKMSERVYYWVSKNRDKLSRFF